MADVSTSPAVCYVVRNGYAWARIFIRHGIGETGAGHPRGWVDVSVLSDFGSFGYCWSHIGSTPWNAFLGELDFEYAMRKMFGAAYDAPLSLDSACARAREIIIDRRRQDCMTKEDARSLWDAIEDCCDQSTFLRDLDENSGGAMYRNDLWDSRWTEPNSQAVGFWSEIWPHFIDAISQPANEVAA